MKADVKIPDRNLDKLFIVVVWNPHCDYLS